jgi:hypothetical protein
MTGRLLIQIEDPADFDECNAALKRVYEEIKRHQGESSAKILFANVSYSRIVITPDNLRLVRLCQDKNFRLALEYYNMPVPNKLKLARELVKRDKTLRPRDRYWPKDSDVNALHQQIKRVLRQPKYRDPASDPQFRFEANSLMHVLHGTFKIPIAGVTPGYDGGNR